MAELKPISTKLLIYDAMLASIKVRKRGGKDFYFLDPNINFIRDEFSIDQLVELFRKDGYSAWFTHRSVSSTEEVTGILVYWGKEDSDAWYSKHVGTIPGESYWK